MADNKDNTYKQSLKATSLFGGVQVFNIIIQIVRSKFVALLLGPTGMGITGLLHSTTTLITSLTSLGLSQSAVRNISEANGSGDNNRMLRVVSVFRRLVWVTGLLGLVACVLLSSRLSEWTFGNGDYTVAFIILSVTLLFQQLTSGQTAIMQGLRKYKLMAKSSVVGSTIGLFVTVPLYYIWGFDAIVPVMVLSSLTALLLSIYYYSKVKVETVPVDKQVLRTDGKEMVIMGVSLSISGIIETIIAYYIRIYIGNHGGLEDVGLFTAGFAIVNTYVGLIFTAMGTDFYPRLSAANKDKDKFNEIINNQMEISLLILSPILCGFIVFIELIIIVLYSGKFLPATEMVYLAAFATFFKAMSWAISFSFLAKGDAKTFFFNELGSKIYFFPLQIIGYKYLGIAGIGVAYLVSYILYLLQVVIVCRHRYDVKVQNSALKIFIEQLPLLLMCLLIIYCIKGWYLYLAGVPVIMLSFYFSYKELNKRIVVKDTIVKLLNKRK